MIWLLHTCVWCLLCVYTHGHIPAALLHAGEPLAAQRAGRHNQRHTHHTGGQCSLHTAHKSHQKCPLVLDFSHKGVLVEGSMESMCEQHRTVQRDVYSTCSEFEILCACGICVWDPLLCARYTC